MSKIYFLSVFFFLILNKATAQKNQETPQINSNDNIGMSYLKINGNENKKITKQQGIAEYRISGKIIEFENLNDLSRLNNNAYILTIQNKKLMHLDVSITKLQNLTVIDVSHNQLATIDENIFSALKKLKKVYVNDNNIPEEMVNVWRIKYPKIYFYTNKDIYYNGNPDAKMPTEK